MGYVRPKYLRKFVFDKMVELGIPESVADFIEGRVPSITWLWLGRAANTTLALQNTLMPCASKQAFELLVTATKLSYLWAQN
jgi:hypothetical protein